MRIHTSAFRHGLTADHIDHAWNHAVAFYDIEPDHDPTKSLCIGPDPAGNLVELLYLKLQEIDLIIHAMPLRQVFADYLTRNDS